MRSWLFTVGATLAVLLLAISSVSAGSYEVTYVTFGDYEPFVGTFGTGTTAIAQGDLNYSNGTVMAWAYSCASVDQPEPGYEDDYAHAEAKGHKFVRFDAVWRSMFWEQPSGTIYHEDRRFANVDAGAGGMQSGQGSVSVELQTVEVLDYPSQPEKNFSSSLNTSYVVKTLTLSVMARGYSRTVANRYWSGWAVGGDDSLGNPPVSPVANFDYTWNQLSPVLGQ